MPSLNLLPFLGLVTSLGLILSSLFMMMCGVFPFPLLMAVSPLEDGTRGIPIIACLQTVAFVHAIFCDGKYLK